MKTGVVGCVGMQEWIVEQHRATVSHEDVIVGREDWARGSLVFVIRRFLKHLFGVFDLWVDCQSVFCRTRCIKSSRRHR